MQHATSDERRAEIARSVPQPAPSPLFDPRPKIAALVAASSVARVAQDLDLSRWSVTSIIAGTAAQGTIALARERLAASGARQP